MVQYYYAAMILLLYVHQQHHHIVSWTAAQRYENLESKLAKELSSFCPRVRAEPHSITESKSKSKFQRPDAISREKC